MKNKALALLLPGLFHSFVAAATASYPSVLAEPFTLYRCTGTEYQDAAEAGPAPRVLAADDHRMQLEILRTGSGTHVFVRAQYTYDVYPSGHTRSTGDHAAMLVNVKSVEEGEPGSLSKKGLTSWQRGGLEASESYVSFPANPAYPDQLFYTSLRFTNGPFANGGASVPVHFKVTQPSELSENGRMRAHWSKLYFAECQLQNLSGEQYVQEKKRFLGQMAEEPAERLHREAAGEGLAAESPFPALREALKEIPLYDADGELLAGPGPALAKGLAGGALGVYAARAVLALLGARGGAGAAAAYFAPLPEERGRLELNLASLGLEGAAVRAFLTADPGAQGRACASDARYEGLCRALSELNERLARGPVL